MTELNIVKLFLNLLLLGDKPPDFEAVCDSVKHVRPNSPDEF